MPPGALGRREPLTSIVLLLCVFDVGGELGEDVDARCVGFPVLRSQFGVPGMQDQCSRVSENSDPLPITSR